MPEYHGSCHCQQVRFTILCSAEVELEDCNCSICEKTGFLHLILPATHFKLLTDEAHLQCYQFNTKIAKHYFCRHCGVKAFYVPRSNPDGVDVNWRCLDEPRPKAKIVPFDGKNWEQHAHRLANKSIADKGVNNDGC